MGFSVEAICRFNSCENRDNFFSTFNGVSCEESGSKDWIRMHFKEPPAQIDTIDAFYYGYDDFYEFSQLDRLENNSLFIEMHGRTPCGYYEFFGEILSNFGATEYFSVTNDDTAGYTEINVLKKGKITTLLELDDCNIDKQRIFELFNYYESGKDLNEILLEELDQDEDISLENTHDKINELSSLLKTTKHEDVKEAIIKIMSDIGTEQSAIALVNALTDEKIQRKAHEALCGTYSPRIVEPLLNIAKTSDHKWTRHYAIACLQNYPLDRVITELWNLFDDENALDISDDIIDALVKIGASGLSEKLLEKLDIPGLRESTIQSICLGLEKSPNSNADSTLKKIAESEHYSMWTRRSALIALATSNGEEYFDYILKYIAHENMASASCEALLRTGDQRAIEHVIKLYSTESDLWRIYDCVAKYGETVIPQLVNSISTESALLPINILRTLNRIGTSSAYRAIHELYPAFKDMGMLREIANTVVEAENTECFHMLMELMHEQEYVDCHRFTHALKKYGEIAVKSLLEFIDDRNHPNYPCALEILGQFGDKRVLPIILQYWESADSRERQKLVEACETTADERVFDLMVECLDSPYYYHSAVHALQIIGTADALDVLLKRLEKSPDHTIIHSIARIADPRSVPILSNVLRKKSVDNNIRCAVLSALRYFSRDDVFEIVSEMAKKDKNSKVKKEAKTILREWEIQDMLSKWM